MCVCVCVCVFVCVCVCVCVSVFSLYTTWLACLIPLCTLRYNCRLREAGKIGVKKGIINGFALALTFFFIYSVYATVFW